MSNRTITIVYNLDSGEVLEAEAFFCRPQDEVFKYRIELEKAIQGHRPPLLVCPFCVQMLKIKGGATDSTGVGSKILHFAHRKDSDECEIKTEGKLTKEQLERIKWNGAKEGEAHKTLKAEIAMLLKTTPDIENVQIEKVVRQSLAKEWKRPDINAAYKGRRFALELQLSTTYLDVIVKRQAYYETNGISILWIFREFNTEDAQRRFTDNDVIYLNNQNAFVFDEIAKLKSHQENSLVLRCYYKVYEVSGAKVVSRWENCFVKTQDLMFDKRTARIFYFDSESSKKEAEASCNAEVEIQLVEKQKRKKAEHRKNLEHEIYKLRASIKRSEDIKEERQKVKKLTDDDIVNIRSLTKAYYEEQLSKNSTYKWFVPATKEVNGLSVCKRFHRYGIYDLEDDFLKQVVDIELKDLDLKKKTKELQTKVRNINSLSRITINGINYSIIVPTTLHERQFILQEYMNMKYVLSEEAESLFVSDRLAAFDSKTEAEQKLKQTGIKYLFDFAPKLAEYNSRLERYSTEMPKIHNEKKKLLVALEENLAELILNKAKSLSREIREIEQNIIDATAKLQSLKEQLD